MSITIVDLYYPFIYLQPETADPGFSLNSDAALGAVRATYPESIHHIDDLVVYLQKDAVAVINNDTPGFTFYIIDETKVLFKYGEDT